MKYISTQGGDKKYTFNDTLLLSVADNGGLFYPEFIPKVSKETLDEWKKLSYIDLCTEILHLYIGDECISKSDLHNVVDKSYSTFRDDEVVPISHVGDTYFAEFFHGPTYSAKDFAMLFLGKYIQYLIQTGYNNETKFNKIITVVICSQSNSGPSCLHSMVDISESASCYAIYSNKDIRRMNERELTSHLYTNVNCVGLDDCNTSELLYSLRKMCAEKPFSDYQYLVCANALNWFRVLLEIPILYLYTYRMFFYSLLHLNTITSSSSPISIAIPTSNLTSVTAGILSKEMGLNYNKLIVACGEKDSFIEFMKTGEYKADIIPIDTDCTNPVLHGVVQFNFCRILYYLLGNGKQISAMNDSAISNLITGYHVDIDIIRDKLGYIVVKEVTNQTSMKTITKYEKLYKYFICPYTALAMSAAEQYINEVNSTNSNQPKDIILCHTVSHPGKYPMHMAKVLECPPGQLVPPYIRNLINLSTRKYIMKYSYETLKNFIFSSAWDSMKQYLH
ncbi:hypothetical protein WA158_003705 [Blastocystis sp. Blastoise]